MEGLRFGPFRRNGRKHCASFSLDRAKPLARKNRLMGLFGGGRIGDPIGDPTDVALSAAVAR
jgi:hypothetical protein